MHGGLLKLAGEICANCEAQDLRDDEGKQEETTRPKAKVWFRFQSFNLESPMEPQIGFLESLKSPLSVRPNVVSCENETTQ